MNKIIRLLATKSADFSTQLPFFLWTIPVTILDQLTKWWIEANVPLNTQIYPIPAIDTYFRFTHVANTGGVFGSFPNTSPIFSIFSTLIIIAMIWYNRTILHPAPRFRLALGLILGGAMGNLIDRFRVGHVTDFINLDFSSIINLSFANWYIFNLADLAIVTGIIIMIYLNFFAPHELTQTGE